MNIGASGPVEEGGPGVRVLAPAKVNLLLRITGRRRDGYHEIVSVMDPIDLCDALTFVLTQGPGLRMKVLGREVPSTEENLVLRAARAYMQKTGMDRGLAVTLEKRIPVAAGLGGGSSDAAQTLLFLNGVASAPLSPGDLSSLAARLGADVPFFLERGPCLATGIGDRLEPLPDLASFAYLLVMPPLAVSTARVYATWDRLFGQPSDILEDQGFGLTRDAFDSIRARLKSGSAALGEILYNDLECVTVAEYPLLETIKRALLSAGAKGALMSGSGPCVFGVFTTREEAEEAQKRIAGRGFGEVFLAQGVARGSKPAPGTCECGGRGGVG